MKKKFALLISLIATVVLTVVMLVACNSIPAHKALNSEWAKSETAVYDVVRYSGEVIEAGAERRVITRGEMTLETTRRNNETITVGGATIDNFTGTLVVLKLTLDDGSFMNTAVAFTSRMIPVASHKNTFVKGYETEKVKADTAIETKATYNGGEYKFESVTTENQGDTESVKNDSGTVKLGTWDTAPYFDDLMLYHVARSSFTNKSAFNPMTFNVPYWTNKSFRQVNISSVATAENVAANGAEAIACTKVAISLTQDFPAKGAPNYVYFANDPIEFGEGLAEVSKRHVITKIEEREMVYTLKSITGNN